MTNNRDPSLNDLTVFLAICEEGGFRAAAKRMGLSPAYVSETMTRLEERLGVPLLNRTTRSVMPTEAGRSLAARVAPLLAETRVALRDAANSRQTVRGWLKLNVPGAVMVDILPPLIDRFLARYPEVRVELDVEDRLVDIVASGSDAGIRYGEHLAQDMISVPIGPRVQHLALVAAPSYLATRGMPLHPRDLADHDCIRLRFSSGALVAWELECDGEKMVVDPAARIVIGVDAVPAAIDLALAGRGILCTFGNWLAPHLDSGALEAVLPDWWPSFAGPRLYFSRRFVPAPLRAFIDMLGLDDVS
ncbi:LysR family transcriptional regulator [Acetobacter okinawensis]|uniref:LysR family transcriptional regulator n=1 Tax=Acetobacter okinawensis TaxID=1076594 RepID=UPI000471B613|nr:LysR family transcriptional regulator [Acetobacter okinawensis]